MRGAKEGNRSQPMGRSLDCEPLIRLRDSVILGGGVTLCYGYFEEAVYRTRLLISCAESRFTPSVSSNFPHLIPNMY